MIYTSSFDGKEVKSHITYGVTGINQSNLYPYVNDIETFKEAVQIARSYRSMSKDPHLARIKRHQYVGVPGEKVCVGRLTHIFNVENDLQIVCIDKRTTESPARILGSHYRSKKIEEDQAREAANRSVSGLSVAEYERLVATIIQSMTRHARASGFQFVYDYDDDARDKCDAYFIERLNDELQYSGFRTISSAPIKEVLQNVYKVDAWTIRTKFD